MKKRNRKQFARRTFIAGGAASLAGFGLLPSIAFTTASPPPNGSQRKIFGFNHRWLFTDNPPNNGARPEISEITFKRITLPHTNKLFPWHGFDDREFQFVSLYRRHFRLPADLHHHRVFIDFGGVMTAATVSINDITLGEHRGGYVPFSFELTPHINWRGDNLVAVAVDSRERKDIPPFGGEIDYLTFGGIYRDVTLRIVPETYIENVFARSQDPLSNDRRLAVRCYLAGQQPTAYQLKVELRDGQSVIATQDSAVVSSTQEVMLNRLGAIELWDVAHPKLYQVRVSLLDGGRVVDEYETRIGFREARFTPAGFFLNDKHLKLRGLNRHQTFPYVGQAMPARVQRRDAWILRRKLKCNIVRTSHYPQSPHFLDACDEYGLLVLEEIPGWQHIGDAEWQNLAVRDVEAMVRRDWNHPSIVLWGVRINESRDDHDFYTRTNQMAHSLDDSRPTGGIRNKYDSELLEDVFTMNDFRIPLRPPNHPLYLNTEFIGHMYPTKRNDNIERITEHAMRHARAHNQLGSDPNYAGGIGWCAFDYNTHANFCSGDRICYHGVADIFRIPKPTAGFYRAQCDPREEIVLEPAFDWSRGDRDESFNVAMVNSNCEQVKIYIKDRVVATLEPDRQNFPNLPHPPFVTNIREGIRGGWGDLKLEGYIGGRKVITKLLSGSGVDRQLVVEPDDRQLIADGIDATRVVLRVTDEYGAVRPFANAAIVLTISGPGEIIGENPLSLFGGAAAVWIKAKEVRGTITLSARHATLGTKWYESLLLVRGMQDQLRSPKEYGQIGRKS